MVEKQVVIKNKNSVENQNGSGEQNGDSEVEAVIKLPSKKSAAKTETKVEVTKKTLPDGSIEEVKKTITKTTIDGKTEIKTKTETTIIPKEDDEEEVEEEEEEEAQEEVVEEPVVTVVKKSTEESAKPKENGQDNIIKTEERSETTTTTSKKIVVVQDAQEEEKEEDVADEDEEIEETEPVSFVVIQSEEKPEPPQQKEVVEESEEEEEEVDEVIQEEVKEEKVVEKSKEEIVKPKEKEEEVEEEVEEEEEYEEAEEKEFTEKEVSEPVTESKVNKDDEELKVIEHKIEVEEKAVEAAKEVENPAVADTNDNKQEQIQEITEEKQEVVVEKQEFKQEIPVLHEETFTPKIEVSENKVPLREPSVPLEKVEDVEIKPLGLGDFLTKTSTAKTEIITNITEKPTGLLTEINRVENIVTVNRTTKTLDRSYEDITQQGVPTIKTYFTPHIDKISTSPQPARPYQPVYPPEPVPERRHSLLLERLSVERQMPSDIYQNNYQYSNQTVEQQRQWSQEPQAEVLTVSNVKPSQITNQQWYQQRENAIYNNVAPSPQPTQAATPSWTQPKPQAQPLYQPQPQYHTPSPQPQYQAPPQPQYQASPQPQQQYQASPQPQQQYQPAYSENIHEQSSNTYQNTYSTYTPKPTNWATNTKPLSPIPTIITPSQPSQYNYLNKDSSESYQKTTQQFSSSSYVPPPWEQDTTYVAPEGLQNFYQAPPQTSSFSPANNQGWKPNLPTSKFSKPPPTAYIPPKPNQSFVVPVSNVEPPKMPGRKTYYSEYERRYISVPESTYIPGENRFQHQPDASPAYYYDNNEPAETVEPQWRRELREFTEKSQTVTTSETNVNPPWEGEIKYAKAPEPSYTPTPTWSQTVRPQSWRERSFESEFVSQEWPKTNTLGRGRPLSSYGKETIPERTRGVSVDRYNPSSYQAPVAAEHPPVQTHTHVPPAPHATGYHNPHVPAYHARASAEPRQVYFSVLNHYKNSLKT